MFGKKRIERFIEECEKQRLEKLQKILKQQDGFCKRKGRLRSV